VAVPPKAGAPSKQAGGAAGNHRKMAVWIWVLKVKKKKKKKMSHHPKGDCSYAADPL